MEKHELLEQVKTLAAQKQVSKDELLDAYHAGRGSTGELNTRLGISQILYYIGGAIVFIGIAVLIGQNWTTLGFATKILVTLGGAIAAYLVAMLFDKRPGLAGVAAAFYLISALVAPIGLYVLFDNFNTDVNSALVQTLISAILFLVFFLSNYFNRKTVFEVFLFAFGTWLFFAFTSFLTDSANFTLLDPSKLFEYKFLITGLAYMFFGQWYSKREHPLAGPLNGFGALFLLASALILGGYADNSNAFWETFYVVLVFAVILLSVHVKSKAYLTFGTIFLMAYILKLTAEYFSSNLGWPLALVIAGLLMIAVGYYSVYINKKYFKPAGAQ